MKIKFRSWLYSVYFFGNKISLNLGAAKSGKGNAKEPIASISLILGQ